MLEMDKMLAIKRNVAGGSERLGAFACLANCVSRVSNFFEEPECYCSEERMYEEVTVSCKRFQTCGQKLSI